MNIVLKETIYVANSKEIEPLNFELSNPFLTDNELNTYEIKISIFFKGKKIERKIKTFGKTQALCAGLSLLKNEIEYIISKEPCSLFSNEDNAKKNTYPFEIKHIFIDIDNK